MIAQTICISDGRSLGYAEFGDPTGQAMVYCHGFASSRLEAALLDAVARKHRIRLIAPDRPGHGLSSYKPDRLIKDWPDDVVELTNALGINRFLVLGVSGGGPYALACGWKTPARVESITVISGLGQLSDSETIRDMRWYLRPVLSLGRDEPRLLSIVTGIIGHVAIRWPAIFMRILVHNLVPPDSLAFKTHPEIRKILLNSIQEALRQDHNGVTQDLILYTDSWGFKPEQVMTHIHVWHGTDDPVVPVAHARALIAKLPHVHQHILQNDGHYSVPLNHMDSIFRMLR
jgi:pimeloyl-ACP methyl ester carboxylesterase